jgi:hypothetical protein
MDAYLISTETRMSFWLGRAIRFENKDGSERIEYYHRGPERGALNHEVPVLNKVLWKFLAEHAHKDLRIVFAGEFDEDEYELVGSGDEEVEIAEYLGAWPDRGELPSVKTS